MCGSTEYKGICVVVQSIKGVCGSTEYKGMCVVVQSINSHSNFRPHLLMHYVKHFSSIDCTHGFPNLTWSLLNAQREVDLGLRLGDQNWWRHFCASNGTNIAMAAPEQPTTTRCPLSYAVSLGTGEGNGVGTREEGGD